MRPTRKPFETAGRRLAALALGLWLSGAGCLVCCARAVEAGGHDAEAVAVSHAILAAGREAERAAPAAMSPDHSCCKARVGTRAGREAKHETRHEPPAPGASDSAAREESPKAGACCRRALKAAELARKPRVEPAHAHAPSNISPPSVERAAAILPHPAPRPRAPDRGGTYLLCRALLI